MKKVIVIGLGSMGKRRIRLIRQTNSTIQICGIDGMAARREEAEELFGIPCYLDIEKAIDEFGPEGGFVCTSPLAHHGIIMTLLSHGLHVFTEINLVSDGYREMMTTAKAVGKVLFLSSTFLYRKDVQYLINCAKGHKMDYIIHTGQYLPDWHPWESYKTYFVGDVRTNACREIMAIDLPWILAAFGKVTDLHVRKSKNSLLDLSYEDNYVISMEHENGSKGVFICDVISRNAGRSAEIFSEDQYLSWRGTPDSLTRFDIEQKKQVPVETYAESIDHQAHYASNIIENAYAAEISTFLDIVDGRCEAPYSFEDDLYTIGLIDRIEGRS